VVSNAPITTGYGDLTVIANLSGDVPGSTEPGAPSTQTVPGSWYGYPSALPIIDTAPGWYKVRLAQRPNESAAWIPADKVTLSASVDRIEVNLTSKRLTFIHAGRTLMDVPVGVGRTATPTATGTFFVTMHYPPPDSSYGAFQVILSAHSTAIESFEGSGDAIIAIHGPVGADAAIGTTGAQVSNGCVRMHVDDLSRLAFVPSGTPVIITS